jgi:hypothetical protein
MIPQFFIQVACNQEIPDLNCGWVTGHPEIFHDFPQGIFWDGTLKSAMTTYLHILSHTPFMIIILSHSMLYSFCG